MCLLRLVLDQSWEDFDQSKQLVQEETSKKALEPWINRVPPPNYWSLYLFFSLGEWNLCLLLVRSTASVKISKKWMNKSRDEKGLKFSHALTKFNAWHPYIHPIAIG